MGGGEMPAYLIEEDDMVDLDGIGKPFNDSKDAPECIHCKESDHEARTCPYYGIHCEIEGCTGVMEVIVGVNLEDTMQELFLKCEVRDCPGIDWIYANKWIGPPEDKPVPDPFCRNDVYEK
jgi:hypothetical protein